MEIGSKVRVLLVDDHLMVRQTLRSILQPHPNIEVVGEAGDGDEAVVSVGTLQPDVVVMDMNMQKMDGITAARLIKTQYPHVLVLGFSADAKDYNVYGICDAASRGFGNFNEGRCRQGLIRGHTEGGGSESIGSHS